MSALVYRFRIIFSYSLKTSHHPYAVSIYIWFMQQSLIIEVAVQVSSMRRHWKLMEVVPLQPMEGHGGADGHLEPREKLTLEDKDAPKGRVDLAKSLQRSRLQAEPVALWRREAGAVHSGHSLWQGLTLEKFMNNCIAWVKLYSLLEECEEKEVTEIIC